ncbi:predicted protein [Nematostella vectensis]|uniref:Centromere protein P n=1 Tax=Nematostella vectensis TaxID=45351 RepID=A7S137_NEMVE|nr:predicted protein [Nematostella vectensis]|eukprot:XP_001634635.1 predicted protein [Nematostella vectensis]
MADSSRRGIKRRREQTNSASEIRDTYSKEIRDLEGEISQLEEDIVAQETVDAGCFSLEALREVFSKLVAVEKTARRSAKSTPTVQRQREISDLQSNFERLEVLTGIKITKNLSNLLFTTSNENNNNNGICRTWRRSISGWCNGIEFTVGFDVEEKEIPSDVISRLEEGSQETPVTASVLGINIHLNNALVVQELTDFIAYVSDCCDLQTFFQGLKDYCECSGRNNDKQFDSICQSVPSDFRQTLSRLGIEQAIELVIRMAIS